MIFSIVGYDAQSGDLGIAVASKLLAVGAVVPWAVAGVSAVATQSYANTTYGPRGLELLRDALEPRVQVLLTRASAYAGPIDGQWNQDRQAALRAWAGVENLEERVLEHGIDPIVLRHLREQHAP
jgi:uncharacterized Ntn-hydrolase superfamily protein